MRQTLSTFLATFLATFSSVVLAIVLCFALPVQAASDQHDLLAEKLNQGDYSRRGADACLGCHDETFPFPINDIFLTVHGQQTDQAPFAANTESDHFPAGLQCEACHGPVGDHGQQILVDETTRQPMINFGLRANAGADLLNSQCLNCHEDHARTGWLGSAHEIADLSCTDCHRIHQNYDPIQETTTQVATCTGCHSNVAADIVKHSAHPIKDSQLVCDSCHKVHGTGSDGLLLATAINDTCYTCHAEKRGPFLFEHEPVAEDCTTCHVPHGSNQPALLHRRPPQLCQGCHSAAGHRNLPQLADQLPPGGASEYLLSRGCTNCHSEVHGSNHPSGDKLRR